MVTLLLDGYQIMLEYILLVDDELRELMSTKEA